MADTALSSETSKAAPTRWRKELTETGGTIAIGLAIALALRVLVFEPYTIPSDSMEPGLRVGDYVVASKYAYGWSRFSIPMHPLNFKGRVLAREPHRGDVIVFKLPRENGKVDYVKRLIGLPGDRVQLREGLVYVNGEPIAQTVAGATTDPDVPERHVLSVLEPRADGKLYATLHEGRDHDGETTDVYQVPKGQYFFLGDNRDNSLDSRWPGDVGVGFVPAEDLVGRAEVILGSWREGTSLFKPWTWITHAAWGRFFRRVI